MSENRPHPDEEFIPRDICPCLRTKTMHLNAEYRRTPFEDTFTADTAIFTCTVTMCEHGPDDDDCLPDKCRPGRSCYRGTPIDLT